MMDSPDIPTVSCLMVSRGDIFPARYAIECYQRQAYSRRELVIISNRQNAPLRKYVRGLGDASIRYIEAPGCKTLGDLRNASVSAARGALLCQWDDDDLSHPQRIEVQARLLLQWGGIANFLSHLLLWWPARRTLAISMKRAWEGSMLIHKEAIPKYHKVRFGEDTVLLDEIMRLNSIMIIPAPKLYCYVIHGRNMCPDLHFDNLLKSAEKIFQEYESELSVLSNYYPMTSYAGELDLPSGRSVGVGDLE